MRLTETHKDTQRLTEIHRDSHRLTSQILRETQRDSHGLKIPTEAFKNIYKLYRHPRASEKLLGPSKAFTDPKLQKNYLGTSGTPGVFTAFTGILQLLQL